MNRSLTTALVFIACFIVGLSHANDEVQGEGDEILYLHCFRPTYGQKIVVDPQAAKDMTPATPPSRLVTLRVDVGRHFEVIRSSMHRVSGRITPQGDSHIATLEGAFGSGFKFSGRIKLEEAFDPEVTWFSGAVFPFRCVISKHKDITPFLKAQVEIDAKKLQVATESSRKNIALSEQRKAEQDGAVQTATAPESKSEGNDNPKPEAKGRHQ